MTHLIKKVSISLMVVVFVAVVALSMLILPLKVYASPYSIGDTGPAGGIIFYVNGSYCLEAAPSDTGSTIWSNVVGTAVGTTGVAFGTGQVNTDAIIAQSGHTTSAAKLCADYELNGYTDWFLPSQDELKLMYLNLYVAHLGSFNSGWYWSSSEYDSYLAWAADFSTNFATYWQKNIYTNHVRPIRVTTPPWVRTQEMTCKQVWINEDNKFQFSFIYPYRDNNWVKIYDMNGKEVFSIDMPYDNPNIIVDLPDGMYTVKTFNDQPEPIQTFIIGKP
jgi:hypothetical protein